MKIKYITPKKIKDDLDDYQMSKLSKKELIMIQVKNGSSGFVNMFIWIINFFIWIFKETQSPQELRVFFNKIVNAYLSFISVFYIRIMTTSSAIFVCTSQPDGSWTLNKSSDLFCYQGIWWAMLPISGMTFLIFGIGTFLYFGTIIVFYQKLKDNETFNQMNKFTMKKFKNKRFYWEGVDTFRKGIISVLQIFFDPMLLTSASIGVIFTAFLLHFRFIPYRKKFQ